MLLTITLGGCATAAAPEEAPWSIPSEDPTATIQVMSLWPDDDTAAGGIIEAFQKDHPTITIKWATVPFDSLQTTLESNISRKSPDPDVYWADQPRISALAARGEVEDLTHAFAEFESVFVPATYQAGVYEDRLYAVPIDNSAQLMFYNKRALTEAGIPFPSADPDERMTWEQVVEDAKKIQAAGASEYGLGFGQTVAYYQLEPLPVQLGGSPGATGPDNLTPDITSDEWIEAFEWYAELFESGVSPRGLGADQFWPNWAAGKFAYWVDGAWDMSVLGTEYLTDEMGVAPMPVFEGGTPATPTGSWSLAMNPFSDEKEAAAIFIKWMAVEGNYAKYSPAPNTFANIESNELYYFSQDIFSTPVGEDARAILEYEMVETAYPRLLTVGYLEFETILTEAFSDIRNGTDVRQALEKAEEKLTAAWAIYQ